MSSRTKVLLMYSIMIALALSVAIRAVLKTCPPGVTKSMIWWLYIAWFGLLLSAEVIAKRWPMYRHIYLVIQCSLALISYLWFGREYQAIMLIALCIHAQMLFTPQTGLVWVGIFTVVMTGMQTHLYGWSAGIPPILMYSSAFFFVAAFSYLLEQSEEATRHSQALLHELRGAYQQLKANAEQAQELAVSKERNRLAQELHDSVTQTLFSMTLISRTAALQMEQDPKQVPSLLQQLQQLAEGALAEIRTQIFSLRPAVEESTGLIPTLKKHLKMLQDNHQFQVHLDIEGEVNLPDPDSHLLFRIIQESLHNIIKHAEVSEAFVRLFIHEQTLTLTIQDHGVGFNNKVPAPIEPDDDVHMGLSIMQERANKLGASFSLETNPGQGTLLTLALPLQPLSVATP